MEREDTIMNRILKKAAWTFGILISVCLLAGTGLQAMAENSSPVDPAICTEVEIIGEAISILDRFGRSLWPGWEGAGELEFTITLPNRDVLLVTGRREVPRNFVPFPAARISGRKVYIDRSREIEGKICGPLSLSGHGDISGVSANIMGRLEPLQENMDKLSAGSGKITVIDDGPSRMTRMMLYVHEAFHCLQAQRALEAEKEGRQMELGELSDDYDADVDYGVYSELEGEALLRAYQEKDSRRALEFFEDAFTARGLKHSVMPPSVAQSDIFRTRQEGTATYAEIKTALMLRAAGKPSKYARKCPPLASAYSGLETFLLRDTIVRMNKVKGLTMEIVQKGYIYGAFYALLLDRFHPEWKKGILENHRMLDDAVSEFLKLTDGEKEGIAERLRANYEFASVRARHALQVKARDEGVRMVLDRIGKTYTIDLRRAQSGFNVVPREFVSFRHESYFPHGLAEFVYGSLKLVSVDTPMRMIKKSLEWVDTEAKPGEKGYELQYESLEGDLYKGVTLKTRGFTMTAKAVKIAETDDRVKISIRD